ncbi:hypothetical protein BGX27_000116 [Mortierella sp. AM989]|nr:hypothetical protein BGX27_000116 [Mortierella sp. AM989]
MASMQRSPRSPVAPAPLLPEMKGEDPSQVESTLLTIEQFKWAILCCGNEVKGRDINVTPPSALLSQRKPEKIKGGRFNGSSSAPQAVEVAPSDAQLALKSLLQVMTLTAEEISQRTTEQRDAANAPHAPPSQMHNPSLLSLMGREGNNGVVDTSNRAKSINQSQYSASFQSLALSVNSTAPVPPSPNSTSTASTQQQLRLRSKKSQSKLVLAQATDAVLHPLSMEELVRLLVHILSVAPEQWIPWHLYDFFIRPQGRKYRDMIELLPTHSQRILRSILETIDGLVDYAVLTAMGQQQQLQQQQQQLKPFSKPRTTASTAAAAVVAALSGGNGSGMVTGENGNGASGLSSAAANGIRQQFSQAHLRSRSDATTVINKPGDELSIASLVAALTMPDSPSQVTFEPISKGDEGGEGFGEQIHQEAAVRARKRRVILDCLASLVFRPRKDMSSNLYGSDPLLNRDSKAMRQNLDPSAATDDRIKARRRYSYISGAAAIPAGPPSATIAMRMQASEKEYEAGLQAFENLVCAFEEECHPHKHSQSSHKPIRIETLVIPPALNGTTISDATGPSLSLPSSPIQVSGPNLLSALPPRQARSLTNRTASPDEVLTTVRSMSPQYSKPIPVDSLIHSRQDQQNNRIYHSIVESPTEISTGEILGAPPTPNDKPKQDPVADQKANPPREIPVTDTFNGVMSMNNNGQNIRPHSESARLRQKSEFSMSAPNFFSPPTSHVKRHRSPTILSATWSAWKGHLLVLEEEECVIGEGSDGDSQNEGGEGPQVQAGE